MNLPMAVDMQKLLDHVANRRVSYDVTTKRLKSVIKNFRDK